MEPSHSSMIGATDASGGGTEHDPCCVPRTGGAGGVVLALTALACPLLCLGPLLLAGVTSPGLVRALQGAPWSLSAGAVLVVLALGLWGARAHQARSCSGPVPPSPPHDRPVP